MQEEPLPDVDAEEVTHQELRDEEEVTNQELLDEEEEEDVFDLPAAGRSDSSPPQLRQVSRFNLTIIGEESIVEESIVENSPSSTSSLDRSGIPSPSSLLN